MYSCATDQAHMNPDCWQSQYSTFCIICRISERTEHREVSFVCRSVHIQEQAVFVSECAIIWPGTIDIQVVVGALRTPRAILVCRDSIGTIGCWDLRGLKAQIPKRRSRVPYPRMRIRLHGHPEIYWIYSLTRTRCSGPYLHCKNLGRSRSPDRWLKSLRCLALDAVAQFP